MPSSPDITELWSNFKNLVKKIAYDKTEVDDKLSTKANNSLVNQSSNGLMSSSDKVKLDGVATGANKTVVDSSLSSSSVNPVQNKIIYQELANKAPASHIHSRLVPTSIPENADLNDYTTQGSFYCPMNVTAVTVGNTPSNQAFHLEVYKATSDSGKGVCQVAYSYRQDNVHIWWRNGYGGNWSEWYEVANKEDIASLNNNKANTNHTHSVVTTSVDGFMSSSDKTKLNGIATGANKTTVDTVLSSSSTNPVQNKVVKAQLDSLNNNKANKNHTHNDYTTTTAVSCSYGTVKKFKKNGWAVVVWQDLNLTNISKNAWVTIANVGWTHQGEFDNHYGNFFTPNQTIPRFEVTQGGLLRAFIPSGCTTPTGNYGHIVYPTAD